MTLSTIWARSASVLLGLLTSMSVSAGVWTGFETSRSSYPDATTLLNHISGIVHGRSRPQATLVVDTGGVVASVQDIMSVRDGTYKHFPGQSGSRHLGFVVGNFSVAPPILRTYPNPASVSLDDLRPKSPDTNFVVFVHSISVARLHS